MGKTAAHRGLGQLGVLRRRCLLLELLCALGEGCVLMQQRLDARALCAKGRLGLAHARRRLLRRLQSLL